MKQLHIGNCLDVLFGQSYPAAHTEIIVVNDFSTDDTADRYVANISDKCTLLNLSDYCTDDPSILIKRKP